MSSNDAIQNHETEQSWKRPWNLNEIVSSSKDWSLAADAGVCELLKKLSSNLIKDVNEINNRISDYSVESRKTNVMIQNAFNDLCMLTNDQFMENLVEDVGSSLINDTAPIETKQPILKEEKLLLADKEVSESLKNGMEVLDHQFEVVEVIRSNSILKPEMENDEKTEDSQENFNRNQASMGDINQINEPIYQPKDPYENRHLPHLIGTQSFLDDDTLGIGYLDEDKDNEDDEDESDTTSTVSQQKAPDSLSDTDDDDDADDDYNANGYTIVDKKTHNGIFQQETTKVQRNHDKSDSDSDGMFESSSKDDLFEITVRNDETKGDQMSNDATKVRASSNSFHDALISQLNRKLNNNDMPSIKNTPTEEADDLFDDDDYSIPQVKPKNSNPSIPTNDKANNAMKEQTSPKISKEPLTTVKPISEPIKSTSSTKKISALQLSDDESEDEFDKLLSMSKKNVTSSNTKTVKGNPIPQKSNNIDDDDDDDDDDWLNGLTNKKPTIMKKTKTNDLFSDDDDDFIGSIKKIETKKIESNKTTKVEPITKQETTKIEPITKQETTKNEPITKQETKPEVVKDKNKNDEKNQNKSSILEPNNIVNNNKQPINNARTNKWSFSEDDDLFDISSKPLIKKSNEVNTKQSPKKSKPTSILDALDDDDDDDLFNIKPKSSSKLKPINKEPLKIDSESKLENDNKNEDNLQSQKDDDITHNTESIEEKSNISVSNNIKSDLFNTIEKKLVNDADKAANFGDDDDDDDLFGDSKIRKPVKLPIEITSQITEHNNSGLVEPQDLENETKPAIVKKKLVPGAMQMFKPNVMGELMAHSRLSKSKNTEQNSPPSENIKHTTDDTGDDNEVDEDDDRSKKNKINSAFMQSIPFLLPGQISNRIDSKDSDTTKEETVNFDAPVEPIQRLSLPTKDRARGNPKRRPMTRPSLDASSRPSETLKNVDVSSGISQSIDNMNEENVIVEQELLQKSCNRTLNDIIHNKLTNDSTCSINSDHNELLSPYLPNYQQSSILKIIQSKSSLFYQLPSSSTTKYQNINKDNYQQLIPENSNDNKNLKDNYYKTKQKTLKINKYTTMNKFNINHHTRSDLKSPKLNRNKRLLRKYAIKKLIKPTYISNNRLYISLDKEANNLLDDCIDCIKTKINLNGEMNNQITISKLKEYKEMIPECQVLFHDDILYATPNHVYIKQHPQTQNFHLQVHEKSSSINTPIIPFNTYNPYKTERELDLSHHDLTYSKKSCRNIKRVNFDQKESKKKIVKQPTKNSKTILINKKPILKSKKIQTYNNDLINYVTTAVQTKLNNIKLITRSSQCVLIPQYNIIPKLNIEQKIQIQKTINDNKHYVVHEQARGDLSRSCHSIFIQPYAVALPIYNCKKLLLEKIPPNICNQKINTYYAYIVTNTPTDHYINNIYSNTCTYQTMDTKIEYYISSPSSKNSYDNNYEKIDHGDGEKDEINNGIIISMRSESPLQQLNDDTIQSDLKSFICQLASTNTIISTTPSNNKPNSLKRYMEQLINSFKYNLQFTSSPQTPTPTQSQPQSPPPSSKSPPPSSKSPSPSSLMLQPQPQLLLKPTFDSNSFKYYQSQIQQSNYQFKHNGDDCNRDFKNNDISTNLDNSDAYSQKDLRYIDDNPYKLASNKMTQFDSEDTLPIKESYTSYLPNNDDDLIIKTEILNYYHYHQPNSTDTEDNIVSDLPIESDCHSILNSIVEVESSDKETKLSKCCHKTRHNQYLTLIYNKSDQYCFKILIYLPNKILKLIPQSIESFIDCDNYEKCDIKYIDYSFNQIVLTTNNQQLKLSKSTIIYNCFKQNNIDVNLKISNFKLNLSERYFHHAWFHIAIPFSIALCTSYHLITPLLLRKLNIKNKNDNNNRNKNKANFIMALTKKVSQSYYSFGLSISNELWQSASPDILSFNSLSYNSNLVQLKQNQNDVSIQTTKFFSIPTISNNAFNETTAAAAAAATTTTSTSTSLPIENDSSYSTNDFSFKYQINTINNKFNLTIPYIALDNIIINIIDDIINELINGLIPHFNKLKSNGGLNNMIISLNTVLKSIFSTKSFDSFEYITNKKSSSLSSITSFTKQPIVKSDSTCISSKVKLNNEIIPTKEILNDTDGFIDKFLFEPTLSISSAESYNNIIDQNYKYLDDDDDDDDDDDEVHINDDYNDKENKQKFESFKNYISPMKINHILTDVFRRFLKNS